MKQKWNPDRRPQPASVVLEVMLELLIYRTDMDRVLDPRDENELFVALHLALHNLTNGEPSEESWCVVVQALNTALMLAELGYGEECIGQLNDALEGCYRARVRADRTGRWALDGPAIGAIREAVRIHEAQVGLAPRADLKRALQMVLDRIDQGEVFSHAYGEKE